MIIIPDLIYENVEHWIFYISQIQKCIVHTSFDFLTVSSPIYYRYFAYPGFSSRF